MLIILISITIIVIISIAIYEKKRKSKLHSLTKEHEVHIPHEDTDKIKIFIENCWSQGYSIPEIEEILLKKGWSINTIKQMFYKSKVPNTEEKRTRIQRHMNTVKQKITSTPPLENESQNEKKIVIVKDKKKEDSPVQENKKTVKKEIKPKVKKEKRSIKERREDRRKNKKKKKAKLEDVSESDEEYKENKDVEELKEELFEEEIEK